MIITLLQIPHREDIHMVILKVTESKIEKAFSKFQRRNT